MSARYVTMTPIIKYWTAPHHPLDVEGSYEERQKHCQDQNSTEDHSDAESYLESY